MQKKNFYIQALLCLLLTLSINFDVNAQKHEHSEVPDSPTYFDIMRSYAEIEDESEGGFYKHLRKQDLFWSKRLHPTGNTIQMAEGLTDYVRNFNQGGNDCTDANWVCLGPTGKPIGNCTSCNARGSGQIHVIQFSPDYANDRTVYAGSNWGGLWRSIAGGDWQELNTDLQLPFTSISDIAVPRPNTIYVTTGDAEMTMGHHSLNPEGTPSVFTPLFTAGVYRSTDGGENWESINGQGEALLDYFDNEGGTIRKIRLNPNDMSECFLATSKGIFKGENIDGSNPTWTLVFNPNDAELKGLEFDSDDPTVIYASGRDVYRSTDSGANWASITGSGTGLDFNNLPYESGWTNFQIKRINITMSGPNSGPSGAFYAYITGNAEPISGGDRVGYFYVYYFNGNTWDSTPKVNNSDSWTTPTRTAIAVSPTNINEVYYGMDIVRGRNNINTGSIFQSIYNGDDTHADIHALVFEPNSNRLFCGTDGGIHIKDLSVQGTGFPNQGGWIDFTNGLQVATPYKFDHAENRTDRIIMGNHDTGSIIYENGQWEIILGGDGYNGEVDNRTGLAFGSQNSDSRIIFSYDFNTGNLVEESTATLRPTDPASNNPNSKIRMTYNALNHPKTEAMYFTWSEIYERLKHSQATDDIDGDSNTTDPDTDITMWKLRSDMGKTVAEWQRQFYEFDISTSNPNYILAAISGQQTDLPDNGEGYIVEPKLFISTTGGCDGKTGYDNANCFTDITKNIIASFDKFNVDITYTSVHYENEETQEQNKSTAIPVITGVVFHPEDEKTAWITFSGYNKDIKVWKTIDEGETWENADPNGSLHNLPVTDIKYQLGTNDRLYIGTDAGIYYKDASMDDWKKFCDFPNVRVTEINLHYCSGKIRASTFGRGLWEGDLLETSGNFNMGEVALEIDQNTTWDFDRGLDRNLRILSGATLTIQGTSNDRVEFSMPQEGHIFIEPGARLNLINAVITNSCGSAWGGIELLGNSEEQQIAAEQGYLFMQNSRLENARYAVYTWDGVSLGSTGGIIEAHDSEFVNNKRSISYMSYENKDKNGNTLNNVGLFDNCSFWIDDDYQFHLGEDEFLGHVSMWQVRGVRFLGCDFDNQNFMDYEEERNYAIRSVDASFMVDVACLTPGTPCQETKRSGFKGFNKAIYATRTTGDYTFGVSEADFERCVKGVVTEGHNLFKVNDSDFEVGQDGLILVDYTDEHEGITILSGTAFTIAQNTFEPVFTSTNPISIGIRAKDTGKSFNNIYKNYFQKTNGANTFYANLANGLNRDPANTEVGLKYKCNENLNNVLNGYDFAVTDQGISFFQGLPQEAAMNTFSLDNSVTGSDFFNNATTGNIQYYYPTAIGAFQPFNTINVITANGISTTCGDIGGKNLKTKSSKNVVENLSNQYKNAEKAYLKAKYKLADKIDGGNTDIYLNELTTLEERNVDVFLGSLESAAPFVSATVANEVLKKHLYFGKERLVNLLRANLDLLTFNRLDNTLLVEIFTFEELQGLRTTANTNSTTRTDLESNVLRIAEEKNHYVDQILQELVFNSKQPNPSALMEWLNNKNVLEADYAIVDLLIHQGEIASATKILNNLPLKYSYTDYERKELNSFISLKNLQIQWQKKGKTEMTLDDNDVNMLKTIADNSQMLAGDQARGLLNFFYGFEYFVPPVFPNKEGKSKEGNTELDILTTTTPSDNNQLLIYPNPVENQVSISYTLPEKYPSAEIKVRNYLGVIVRSFDVADRQTKIDWKVRHLNQGTYYVTVEYKGKIIESAQKMVVVR